MLKLTSTLAGVLLFFGLEAQNFWQDNPYLNRKNDSAAKSLSFISVSGFFNAGCDGVNNQFLTQTYRGGFLDSTFIEESSGALLPSNRIGVTTEAGITYGKTVNDSTGEMFTVSLLRRNNISGRFSDDAFHLAFQGNTRYKGEQADFGGTRITAMTWSQFKFGYITPHKNGGVQFSFSLIAGHRYNEANIHYGKLFTDSQGLSVEGSVAADYWSSDTANRAPFAVNGWGTSVDVTWTRFWQVQGGNLALVKLDFIDFGFINWNDRTIHRYTDTTFAYNGVDISQLFIDPDYVVELPEEEEFIKTDTTEFHRSIFLPAVIRGSFARSFFANTLFAKATFAMPFWSEALPFGSLTATWKNNNIGLAFTGGIAYGGYSRLQVPVKAELFMIRNTTLEIGTTNALGFINTSEMSGYGAFMKLSYCF